MVATSEVSICDFLEESFVELLGEELRVMKSLMVELSDSRELDAPSSRLRK